MRDLSYAAATDPRLKRWTIRVIENLAGRRKYLPLYERWQQEIVPHSQRMMSDLLQLIDTKLDVHSGVAWPPVVAPDTPLVMVANHPFGIGDGIAALSLAEQLGRPYRVLINNELLKVPEVAPYALPIDFSETREAVAMNIASRAEARRLLREGVTLVVFPAGGVATAVKPFGRAEELPWKTFTARLIQQAHASVLPVFFEGQNSRLFHAMSRISLTLRLSLMVSEFRRIPGGAIKVHIGPVTPFDQLAENDDRTKLTIALFRMVQALDPKLASAAELDQLVARHIERRGRFRWEKTKKRG